MVTSSVIDRYYIISMHTGNPGCTSYFSPSISTTLPFLPLYAFWNQINLFYFKWRTKGGEGDSTALAWHYVTWCSKELVLRDTGLKTSDHDNKFSVHFLSPEKIQNIVPIVRHIYMYLKIKNTRCGEGCNQESNRCSKDAWMTVYLLFKAFFNN